MGRWVELGNSRSGDYGSTCGRQGFKVAKWQGFKVRIVVGEARGSHPFAKRANGWGTRDLHNTLHLIDRRWDTGDGESVRELSGFEGFRQHDPLIIAFRDEDLAELRIIESSADEDDLAAWKELPELLRSPNAVSTGHHDSGDKCIRSSVPR